MSDKMTVDRDEYARCVEYVQAGSLCVNDTLYAVGGVSQQGHIPEPVNATYRAGASVEYVEFQKPTPAPADTAPQREDLSAPPIPGETTVFVGFNPRVRPGAPRGWLRQGIDPEKPKDAHAIWWPDKMPIPQVFDSLDASQYAMAFLVEPGTPTGAPSPGREEQPEFWARYDDLPTRWSFLFEGTPPLTPRATLLPAPA